MDRLRENVAQALNTYMSSKNISASEMARRCRLTPSGLHRILHKQRIPRVETLTSIAEEIGISISDIINPN